MFRIVSVPFTNGNKTRSVHTENKYLIVANDRTRYQFLSESDLQQCDELAVNWSVGDHIIGIPLECNCANGTFLTRFRMEIAQWFQVKARMAGIISAKITDPTIQEIEESPPYVD